VAPFGLDDLFGLVLRRNPRQVTAVDGEPLGAPSVKRAKGCVREHPVL
jgi:hypothetical protein